eukprot:scaffold105677_cov45-Phaeocystis_antarctica.AAC.1
MSPPSASYTRTIRSRPAHAISPAPGKAEARGAKVSATHVLSGRPLSCLHGRPLLCCGAVQCVVVYCGVVWFGAVRCAAS